MATLNPNIILSGSNPNLMGNVAQGMQMRAFRDEMQQRNALADMYQQHGQGLVSGDPGSINALAAVDPRAAMDFQTAHTQNQRAGAADSRAAEMHDARLQEMRETSARAAREDAARLSEAERTAAAEKLESGLRGAATFAARGDQAGLDEYMRGLGMDPIPLADFPAVAASVLGNLDALNDAKEFYGGKQIDPAKVQSSVVLDDGTSVLIMNDGARRVLDAQGAEVSGGAAADAIRAARDYTTRNQRKIYNARREGTLTADIDLGGEAAATEDVAKATVKAGVSAWEDYGKIQTSLSNIDEAISAIDRGAASGLVYKMLPNVTEASASLNNAMNRMGLDVIGAVTFGALSEGELRLAMETAVPQNLEAQDLKAWLTRRRAAQAKAATMLADAAQFLTVPGNTINDWIARNRNTGAQNAPSAPAQNAPRGSNAPTQTKDGAIQQANNSTPAQGEPLSAEAPPSFAQHPRVVKAIEGSDITAQEIWDNLDDEARRAILGGQ